MINFDINCATLAADLLVPPLALFSILLIVLNAVFLCLGLVTGEISPFFISMALFVIFISEIAVAWFYFGREILRINQLIYVPVYIIKKVPLYLMIMINRQVKWVKTPRENRNDQDDH